MAATVVKRLFRAVCLTTTLVIAAPADSHLHTQSEPRRVPWRFGVPLASVVQPGEKELIVYKIRLGDSFHQEASAKDELLVAAENSDDIIVAEVTSMASHFIDDGNWVESTFTARVSEILKRPEEPLNRRRGTWTLFHDGGEIIVNGTKLKVGLYPTLTIGQRYLVFTAIDYGGRRTQWGYSSDSASEKVTRV